MKNASTSASEAAAALGRIKSPAKAKAARFNGKKGGRPKKHDGLPPKLIFGEDASDLVRAAAEEYRRVSALANQTHSHTDK